MSEVCSRCGLPKDLCVCDSLAREEQRITIRLVKRKYGKKNTIIEGMDEKKVKLKDICKKLKFKLACGGTVKEGVVELQGAHLDKVKEELVKLGFSSETIDVKR